MVNHWSAHEFYDHVFFDRGRTRPGGEIRFKTQIIYIQKLLYRPLVVRYIIWANPVKTFDSWNHFFTKSVFDHGRDSSLCILLSKLGPFVDPYISLKNSDQSESKDPCIPLLKFGPISGPRIPASPFDILDRFPFSNSDSLSFLRNQVFDHGRDSSLHSAFKAWTVPGSLHLFFKIRTKLTARWSLHPIPFKILDWFPFSY